MREPEHARLDDGRSDEASAETQALIARLYAQLKVLAKQQLRGQPANHTLQPTALLNEVCLKLLPKGGTLDRHWNSEEHFRATAARAMRQVLVDHARAKKRLKRGTGVRVILDECNVAARQPEPTYELDILELDSALERLAVVNQRAAKVVEWRFFAGFEIEQSAKELGVSASAVKKDWEFARAWLAMNLRR